MAGKTTNQLTPILAEIPDTVIDPETGSEIQVTDEMRVALMTVEQQMRQSFMMLGLALRTVRDQRLYLLRACGSMEEYLIEYFSGSVRAGKQLIQVADRFHDMPDKEQFFSLPKAQLLELAGHPETMDQFRDGEMAVESGLVTLPDGELVTFEALVNRLRAELKDEQATTEKKLNKKINDLKQKVGGKDQTIENLNQQVLELNEDVDRRSATIQDLLQSKDIDPDKIVLITTRKKAVSVLEDRGRMIRHMLGEIQSIDKNLIDAELAATIRTLVASIEVGLNQLRDAHPESLYAPEVAGDGE